MKPADILLFHLVNPLVFIVEAYGAHRILSYLGQTLPRIWKAGFWETLDAETVFRYPPEQTAKDTNLTEHTTDFNFSRASLVL